MNTPKELFITLLQLTSKGDFTAKELLEESFLSRTQVESALEQLAEEQLIKRKGDTFKIDPAGRVLIATKAVRLGVNIESVSRHLSWQEFEQFIEYALNINGYVTLKHHHLKADSRRYEIDIIGARSRIIVAIDCKHWSSGGKSSAIKKSAESQLERVRSLSTQQNLKAVAVRLGMELSGQICIVPVVATLMENPAKICSGVPIVPVYKFARFLEEVPCYLDQLSTITLELTGNFT
jgi:Holliday junction resolvase-like predicted endonuclease